MATLAPQATCPLLDLQCSPDTFWSNKENALIALGINSGVQASFPYAYALCSGRQHTKTMYFMFCSLKYLYICVFLLLSPISV